MVELKQVSPVHCRHFMIIEFDLKFWELILYNCVKLCICSGDASLVWC